jgi:hypothetical protein
LLIFLIVCLARSAGADEAASTQPQISATSSGEQLLATPPKDWQQTYRLNTDKTRLVDYIPMTDSGAGDSENKQTDWKTKLSFESHQSLAEMDPISILMGELDTMRQNCEKIESFNLFSGLENRYPTSVRLTFCGENAHTGEGEISISKAIQGNDYLYLIKLIHRVPAFESNNNNVPEQLVASWADYFGQVTVCDDTRPDHPCTDNPEVQTY